MARQMRRLCRFSAAANRSKADCGRRRTAKRFALWRRRTAHAALSPESRLEALFWYGLLHAGGSANFKKEKDEFGRTVR
jgi:hypothetical protein